MATKIMCDAKACLHWSEKDGGLCTLDFIAVSKYANCLNYEEKEEKR